MLEIKIGCEKCGEHFSHTLDNCDITLMDGVLTAYLSGWNSDEFGSVYCPGCWGGELGGTQDPDGKVDPDRIVGKLIDPEYVMKQIEGIATMANHPRAETTKEQSK